MFENYIKTALKVLLRRKFFTFISMFAITFTLLVLIVAAAMLDFIFAPHAPESRLDRTLGVYAMGLSGDHFAQTGFGGYKVLNATLRDLPGAERVSLVRLQSTVTTYLNDRKFTSWLKQTDGEFWKVYDFEFIEGRPFSAADDAAGQRVAVINRATRERFFGDAPALGKTVELDNQRYRVVGVVENVPFTRIVPFSDVWVPIGSSLSSTYRDEYVSNFFGVVVAKDRSAFPGLKAEFAKRLARVPLPSSTYTKLSGGLDTEFEALSRMMLSSRSEESHPERLKAILLAMMFLFMLIPAVNLMNISISRTIERSGEIGVRKAFGASSRALIGQFMTENVLVTVVGGVISVIVAQIVLMLINSSGVIPYGDFHVNWRIFVYGLVLAIIFGFITSVYPAWRMSRLHPAEALRRQS
jgi:putative ABC transport system permease protein